MKKKRKNVKKIAEEILKLEKECQQGKNVQENTAKIEEITSTLSFVEMLMIDEYISKKFFDI